MPVITLYYDDLERLSDIDRDTIIKNIPMLGCDIERIEEDHIDIEFFPNRPDLYSVEGVARAIRGFLGIETRQKVYRTGKSDVTIRIDESVKPIRPFLVGAVVRNLRFDGRSIESLMNLQEDLHWAVGRNRKKVSIGVHDLKHIRPPFRYIAEDPDFKFIPLDFDEPVSMRDILRKHPKGIKFANILEKFDRYPLILDSMDNVLSFPPIINGNLTSVSENTTDLFIEITGLDGSVKSALNIVTAALAERGGSIESVEIINSGEKKITPDLTPLRKEISTHEVESLLGFRMPVQKIVSSLEKMRYGAIIDNIDHNRIYVDIPVYRADIMHPWDIIEDIAIGYGFNNIEPEFPKTVTIGKAHAVSEMKIHVREIMTGSGYFEVMPFTLTNERVHFQMMRREKTGGVTCVRHPISEDHTMVRTTILPNLLEILSINKHHTLPQRIFEVGEVVVNSKNEQHVAAVTIHPEANFSEIRGLIESLMRELNRGYSVSESADKAFLEGRRADVFVNGKKSGVFGEFHPEVILNFGLEQPIIGFEIRL